MPDVVHHRPETGLVGLDLAGQRHGAVSLTLQNREMDQPAKWDATREAVDTLMEIIAATRPDRNATS